ncbi:hypothetical protein M513_08587 [Trichuris suis]|uniref:Mos1 transposase HTH domain-containing protein n=1 Tax=Trichuris suis TaxID=68888 RepID=A0A085LZX3_9BILA|nr:hypothetical protein M513_08587 [Trichuris suis]
MQETVCKTDPPQDIRDVLPPLNHRLQWTAHSKHQRLTGKMECQVDKKEHLRHVLLFLPDGGLSAVAAAEKIHAVYEEEAISDRVARKSGRPSDLDEEKLNALVHEDPRQSTRELAEKIGCGHLTVSRHLLSMGNVQKMGSWVPHQLSRDDKIQRVSLPHPGYSPDLAPSDYHLFRSLAVNLRGVSFNNDENVQKWLSDFFSSKPPHFYRLGIEQVASRWKEVVNSEGEYIVD